jgi:hypothetical protein
VAIKDFKDTWRMNLALKNHLLLQKKKIPTRNTVYRRLKGTNAIIMPL